MSTSDERVDDNNTKQRLAAQRTDWAQERTVLAKQRTFSAWVRTGLGAMAVGAGVVRLLSEVQPQWMVLLTGTLLVLTGGIILVLGFWTYYDTFKKLQEEGVQAIPPLYVGLITVLLLLSTCFLLVTLYFT